MSSDTKIFQAVSQDLYIKDPSRIIYITIDEYDLENEQGEPGQYYQITAMTNFYNSENKNITLSLSPTKKTAEELFDTFELLGKQLEMIKVSPLLYACWELVEQIEIITVTEYAGNYPKISNRFAPIAIVCFGNIERIPLTAWKSYQEAIDMIPQIMTTLNNAHADISSQD